MKRSLFLLLLLLALVPASYGLNWRISRDGSSWVVEDQKSYSVSVHVPANTPNGTYTVTCHWSWVGGGVGSGTGTSDVTLGQFTVTGTAAQTITVPSTLVVGVNEMNGHVPGGHGPTTNLPNDPSVHFTGTLTLQVKGITNAAGVAQQFSPVSTNDPYDCAFADTQPSSVPSTGALNIFMNGTAENNTAKFEAQSVSNDGNTHTIKLYYNGVLVDTVNIAAGTKGGTPIKGDSNFTIAGAVSGDSYYWVVDGVAGGGGVVNTDNASHTFIAPPLQASWLTTLPPVIGDPTPAPTNGGTTTTSPGSSQPPTSIVNNPTTTIGGSSTGATNQDIYNDVRQALLDTLGPVSPTGSSPDTTSLDNGDDSRTRGKLDDIQGEIDGHIADAGSFRDAVMAKLDFSSNISAIPTGLGSVSTIDFGNVTIGGQSHHIFLDLAPVSSVLSWVRELLLWLCRFLFVIACIRLIVSEL